MNRPHRKWVAMVAAILWLAAFAPGCAGLSPTPPALPAPSGVSSTPSAQPPAPAHTDRDGVTIHTWRAISAPPLQPWDGLRTALYTYVLVGDVGVRGQDINAATRGALLALDQLLKEVQAGQGIGQDAARWPAEMLAQANQFCIPAVAAALDEGTTAKAGERKRVTLDSYDIDLSRDYLNLFRIALQTSDQVTRSLSGVGPFLVASRKPLGEIVMRNAAGALTIDTASPILLIDMTGKHKDSMPAYLGAFQETVRKDVVGRTSPGLLLASIGSSLLKLNEALPFVAEAHAGTTRILLAR